MSHVPHELVQEFPEYADAIHTLKTNDAHFARLFDEYHDVNREVHRGETDVEPMSDETLVTLRKKRMALKDELYAALKQSEQAS
ncbi:YdcH family protein [Palleronia caenipelagi]|uniref:DUF465 domain-containing protein n=1 Tax=Palleronia caenipelagi TaxID=2489174 RepID=A0A547Q362_9RHOB|nr:YdcH family protein [Palleronia caenipelagi]TRD20803.1 DUF465 domain-containing protein [Palleronia caenipelagi]